MLDLIDALEENKSPLEIVELLKETNFNQEDLKSYAVKHNICPKCCGDLVLHTWRESRGRHFGFPAFEGMSELRCDCCGWSLD